MNGAVLVLSEARRLVIAGWVQQKAYDSYGGVCAGHAIDAAYGNLFATGEANGDDRVQAAAVLLQVAVKRSGRFYPSIPDWNDDDNRTKIQVIAAFDEAIALLSEKPDTPQIEVRHKLPEHTALGVYLIPADLEAVIAEANKQVCPIEIEPVKTGIFAKVKDLVGV